MPGEQRRERKVDKPPHPPSPSAGEKPGRKVAGCDLVLTEFPRESSLCWNVKPFVLPCGEDVPHQEVDPEMNGVRIPIHDGVKVPVFVPSVPRGIHQGLSSSKLLPVESTVVPVPQGGVYVYLPPGGLKKVT